MTRPQWIPDSDVEPDGPVTRPLRLMPPPVRDETPDEGDFVSFFTRVLPLAVGAARRVTGNLASAEDAASEALARAYLRWPRLAAAPYRDAWVLRVAINEAIGRVRTDARRQRILRRQPPPALVVSGPEPGARPILVEAIQRLPRRQREVIALRYFADLSLDEIAETLRLSTGTVKTHLHRATEALRRDVDSDLLEGMPS